MKQHIEEILKILPPPAEGLSSTKRLKEEIELNLAKYNKRIESLLQYSDRSILYAALSAEKIGEENVFYTFLALSTDMLLTQFMKNEIDEQTKLLKTNTEKLLSRLPKLLKKIDDLTAKKYNKLSESEGFKDKKTDLKSTLNKFINLQLKMFSVETLELYCLNHGQKDFKMDTTKYDITRLWEEPFGKEVLANYSKDKIVTILSYTIESQDPYLTDLIASEKMIMPPLKSKNPNCKAVRYTNQYLQGLEQRNFKQALEGYKSLKTLNYLPDNTLEIMKDQLFLSLTAKELLIPVEIEDPTNKKIIKELYNNLDANLKANIDRILKIDLYKAAEIYSYMELYEESSKQAQIIKKHIIKNCSYQDLIAIQKNLREMEFNLESIYGKNLEDYQEIIENYESLYNDSLYLYSLKKSISGFIVLGVGAVATTMVASYIVFESIQIALSSSVLEKLLNLILEKTTELVINSSLPAAIPAIAIGIGATAIGIVIFMAAESLIRYAVEKNKINNEVDKMILKEPIEPSVEL